MCTCCHVSWQISLHRTCLVTSLWTTIYSINWQALLQISRHMDQYVSSTCLEPLGTFPEFQNAEFPIFEQFINMCQGIKTAQRISDFDPACLSLVTGSQGHLPHYPRFARCPAH
ncbi:hypothetical protein BJ165DRAFT_1439744 [Panaeolus papilionaceus]|nr:hypothetical protein BJ165DRAFT_1439744 [Panaeolus papilionaceus]